MLRYKFVVTNSEVIPGKLAMFSFSLRLISLGLKARPGIQM